MGASASALPPSFRSASSPRSRPPIFPEVLQVARTVASRIQSISNVRAHMKRCTSIRLITALVLSLIPGAAPFSAIAQSPPDWTGFYALPRGKDLGSFKPLNPNLHEVIVAHLQPWA